MATASEDHTLKLWDAASGHMRATLQDVDKLRCIAFALDGKTIASGNVRGELKVWDVAGARLRATFPRHTRGIRCVAFAPDGLRLVTRGVDQAIRFWDLLTELDMLTLQTDGAVTGLAFSRSADLAASVYDGRVLLWRAGELRHWAGWSAP